MLLDEGVFGDVSEGYHLALQSAFEHFTTWRVSNKITCSQKRFRPSHILRKGYGFYLNAKGYNARVLCEWLLFVVTTNSTADPRHHNVEVALTLNFINFIHISISVLSHIFPLFLVSHAHAENLKECNLSILWADGAVLEMLATGLHPSHRPG